LQREHIGSEPPSFAMRCDGWNSTGTAPGSVSIVRECELIARNEMVRKLSAIM